MDEFIRSVSEAVLSPLRMEQGLLVQTLVFWQQHSS